MNVVPYIPKPKTCFLDDCDKDRIIGGRQTYKKKNRYYQWDELHGEIEVYNKRGYHMGALDADGKFKKEAERGETT